jgi:Carbohydrate binding domain
MNCYKLKKLSLSIYKTSPLQNLVMNKNIIHLLLTGLVLSAVSITTLSVITLSASATTNINIAGWRSSSYGYQTAASPNYWINVANTMANKFSGTSPGGIWLVGETQDDIQGTILYMSCIPSSKIRCGGVDISEPYLTAFDKAGLKVILQVEPLNANVITLMNTVMTKYKKHPSVIGFGVDNEWFGTCVDGCKATASQIISWNNALHAINPNYILMIKHFDEMKLPTGIPTDILIIGDDEQNGNLNTLVSEHVAMENRFPNNPYGAQIGYPSDKNIWGSMSNPAKTIGTAIQTAVGKPISVIWVDFSITQVFPKSQYDVVPTPTQTPYPIPQPQNQIQNGDFSNGKTAWTFYDNGVGTFTTSYYAKITINTVGNNMQLYQPGISLQPNTNYRLTFDAYSNTGHDFKVNLFKGVSPFTNYGLSYVVNLNTTRQTFTSKFKTTGFTGNVADARLQFYFVGYARSGDTYWIDNIRLEKI